MKAKIFWLLISVFFFTSLFAQVDLNKPLPTDPDVIVGKLPNGLTYYIKHNEKPKNRVFLRLVVNAGSVCEDDDQQGLAHFTEHMAFNGTKNFPKHKLIKFLESIGMKFGADLNAYTSFDRTVYMLEIPADNPAYLDTALLILHDWAHYLSLENEEIDNERGVILEEWRLGRGPQDRLMRKTFPVIVAGSKYAERLPIGKPEIIKNFKYDVLKRFYHDWYRPDLEAVIVVGDIDPKVVQSKIEKLFTPIPAPKNERPRIYPPIPAHKDIKAVVATDSEAVRTTVAMYWKHPMQTTKTIGDYRNMLIRQLVTSMLFSRFKDKMLKPGNPYALAFSTYNPFLDKTDVFVVYAIAKKNRSKDAIKALLEDIESAKRYGFAQSELERAKKQILAQAEKYYKERNKTESNYFISQMQDNFDVRHDPIISIEQEYKLINKLINTITEKDVNQAIKQLATDENLVITVTGPTGQQYPTADQIVELANQVRQEKIKPYKDVKVVSTLINQQLTPGKIIKQTQDQITGTTTLQLQNGIRVIIKPTNFKNDEILLKAYSLGGYSLYSGKDILNARLAAKLVDNSGLGQLKAAELDKFLADKNVSLSPFISLYYEGFSGQSTVKDFETMLQMVYLYFTSPRFDKDSYKSYIEQQIAIMQNKAKDPLEVWRDSIRFLLNNRSIYSKPLSVDDLKKVNFKRAYKIFKQRFGDPGSFTFILVGNVNIDSVRPLLEKYLGALPAIAKKESYRDVNATVPTGKVIRSIIYKGNDKKSLAYFVFTGDVQDNLKNEILLDGISEILTKRLLDTVREAQALTYSIAAFAQTIKIPRSQYIIPVFYSSKPDTVEFIAKEIIKLAHGVGNKISDAEYNSTIRKLLRSYEVNIRQNDYWLSELFNMYLTNGKPDFVTDYEKTVKSLTKQELTEAAKKYFNPDSYLFIALKSEATK